MVPSKLLAKREWHSLLVISVYINWNFKILGYKKVIKTFLRQKCLWGSHHTRSYQRCEALLVADRYRDSEAALKGVCRVRLVLTFIEGNLMLWSGLNPMFICSIIGVTNLQSFFFFFLPRADIVERTQNKQSMSVFVISIKSTHHCILLWIIIFFQWS